MPLSPHTYTSYHPPAPPWHAEAGAAQTRGPCRAQLRQSQEEQGAQGWGELRQPRAPQPPQTQETSGEVPDRTNKQTNVRGTRQSKRDSHGPSSHPKPGPSPKWAAGLLGQAGPGTDEERGEPSTPQALSTVAARTGHHPEGWPSQPEAPQLCVGMFLPCRIEGDGLQRTFSHIPSQPGALHGCHWEHEAPGVPRKAPRQVSPAALSWRVPAQATLSLPPRHGLSPSPAPGSPP